ncbi:uncharacterized protein [Rhodnius prolixus]|uniref:uncharacterized protein n=1 Tax=Rhodnius prolixus TaxID=13249 RepID=UPI003D1899C9
MAGPSPDYRRRKRYNLVVMDYFSKWAEAHFVADQDATTAGAASTVYQILGVRSTRTTPLHSDGMVEQFNMTLGGHWRTLGKDHQENWDEHTPPIMMAYRSAVHETTGRTPASLVFGRGHRLTVDLPFGSLEAEESDVDSCAAELRHKLRAVRGKVRDRKRLDSDRTTTLYGRQVIGRTFQRGGKVWSYKRVRKKGKPPKLLGRILHHCLSAQRPGVTDPTYAQIS